MFRRERTRAFSLRGGAPGSTTSEYLVMVAVIVVAITAAAQVFVDGFTIGVAGLSVDISKLLSLEDGRGPDRGGQGGGQDTGGGPLPPDGVPDDGAPPSLPDGATSDLPPPAPPPPPPPDDASGDSSEGGDQADEDEPSDESCPYVFDEASDRWRDPETGQYVSFDAAAAAGC